jgi:hypothetical protein
MISKMEACQMEMYEAMANVQATSIAAIHMTSTGAMPFQRATDPRVTTVGAMTGVAAMMKLTGILKSKEKKA